MIILGGLGHSGWPQWWGCNDPHEQVGKINY